MHTAALLVVWAGVGQTGGLLHGGLGSVGQTDRKSCSMVGDLILSTAWNLCPSTLSHKKPDVRHDFMVMDVGVTGVDGKVT